MKRLLLIFLLVLFPTFVQAEEPPHVDSVPIDLAPHLLGLADPDSAVQQKARESLQQMGEEAIPPLIAQGLGSTNETVRQNAMAVLVSFGAATRQPLLKALKDPVASVRAGAAHGLGQLRDKTAIRPLISTLADKETLVRAGASTALVTIGSPTVAPLIKALSHPALSVRKNAAVILAKIGSPAIDPLTEMMKKAEPGMRAVGMRIISRTGSGKAIPVLINGLGEKELEVRAQAVQGLIPFGRQVVPRLLATLKGSASTLHDGAVDALVGIGKVAVPELSALIQEPKVDYRIRARAGVALRRLQWTPRNLSERVWGHIVAGEWEKIPIIPKAIPPLMATLESPLDQIRAKASQTLVPFREQAVTPLATEILRQKNPFFLEAAAQTLGNIGIRDFLAVEALTGLLSNSQFLPVQSSVIDALGKVGNYLAVEPLLLAAEDGKRLLRIRVQAVDALRNLGDPRVTMRLITALKKSAAPTFREAIVVALGQLRDPRSAPPLIALLNSENEALRRKSEEALLLLRPLPIELLINALGDRRPRVQQSASRLLTQIGEPATEQLVATLKEGSAPASIRAKTELLLVKILEALPQNVQIMVKALEAPSDRIRLLAVQSLSQIKSTKAVPLLLAMSEQEWHYPPSLRKAAKDALQQIKTKVDPPEWQGALQEERRMRLNLFIPIGQFLFGLLSVVCGYWIFMSLLAGGLSALRTQLGLTDPSYLKFLIARLRKSDPPIGRLGVLRSLRMGFFNWQSAVLPLLILSALLVLPAVWARMLNSIIGTVAMLGSVFFFLFWLQSAHGVELVSRILDYRGKFFRLLFAPLAYLGLILFPNVSATVKQRRRVSAKQNSEEEPQASLEDDDPFSMLAMLLKNFSPSERITLLQVLGEHAAAFPPADPKEVLNLIFTQAQERLTQRDDIRAFLITLAPAAMSLSRTDAEIPEILSKMLSLVGNSNSLVKLESFFNEIKISVDVRAMKGAFAIILELLQSGFFPTTELVEEAKLSTDRPILYQSWKGVMAKIGMEELNVSDAIHLALHYTTFRHRVQVNRLLALIDYRPEYVDYKRIVEKRSKGRKAAEREKQLKEIANQLNTFVTNLRGKDSILISPWLTRRLFEAFGQQEFSFDALFSVSKSEVWIAQGFGPVEALLPEEPAKSEELHDLVEDQEVQQEG